VLQDGSTLAVQQFHFTTWPDHGVPLYPTPLLAFHKKFRSCCDIPHGPTVIHCSAGVGRTGTFIALDYLLDQAKAEGVVNVYGCVCQMRNSRVNMVQTLVIIDSISSGLHNLLAPLFHIAIVISAVVFFLTNVIPSPSPFTHSKLLLAACSNGIIPVINDNCPAFSVYTSI